MLESVTIASEATFASTPTVMTGLSQFNFIYGANGTGKTTISRIIDNSARFPHCLLSWKGGTTLETIVYNRDFVSANFHECEELPGIFTLGEKDAKVIQDIATAKDDLDKLQADLQAMRLTLQGDNGSGGKKGELAIVEDSLKDACWAQKIKYDAKFKSAFEGCRSDQKKFKLKILQESTANKAILCELAGLEKRAETVFGESPTATTPIQAVGFEVLLGFEHDSILAKRVVGKTDIDIAALILKLGNSDWVRAGRTFYDNGDRTCPFCQQEAPETLEHSLNSFFDEAFEKDSGAIKRLETSYKIEASRIQQVLSQLISGAHPFLDSTRLQELKEQLDAKLLLNTHHLEKKLKEPSQSVALEPLDVIVNSINAMIEEANDKIVAHNLMVKNLDSEKKRLSAEVWRYLLDVELKDNLKTYNEKKARLEKAIDGLELGISTKNIKISEKSTEISNLEKQTTSIQPTVDGINRLLKSFGFRGFELKRAENQLCYKLVRPDGSDAKDTLSEGERTFVTFLYFYHLLKGSLSESGTATNRIVVFDDPVSSLDSDILFIVGSLIKGLFDEVRTGKGQIRQIFILTHNVYFHKEVTFNPDRQQVAMKEETFWIVRKADSKSTLVKHSTNPIKTSYELLWAEVRNKDRSNLAIQNTLRRILEHYFRILGGVNPDRTCDKFTGKDRLICKSLFSWVNDGSHSAHDDLFVSNEDTAVEAYLRVFREIFKQEGHASHYKMMMGDAWEEESSELAPDTAPSKISEFVSLSHRELDSVL